MNRLAVLAALLAPGGCVFSSDDDPDDALITAKWSVVHLETNTEVQCPNGFPTAALYSQPIDEAGNATAPVIVDQFDCSARTGTSDPLVPGRYLSWLEITNQGMTDVFAKSLSEVVDTTTDDQIFSTQILDDGGYFKVSWKLLGKMTGNELTCADAGAINGVEAIATDVSNARNSSSDLFDCEVGVGITDGYLAGTYTVSVAALGANDAAVGTAPDRRDVIIEPRNAVTELAVISIPITGK